MSSVVSIPQGKGSPSSHSTGHLPPKNHGFPPKLGAQLPNPKASPSSAIQEAQPHIPQDILEIAKKPVTAPEPVAGIPFSQFAAQFHLKQHQEAQKRSLLQRLRHFRVSICLSTRLLRLGAISQKGLVESFKLGDKASFISIYNNIHDVREACEPSTHGIKNPSVLGHDSLLGFSGTSASDSEIRRPYSFVHQLTPTSRECLLEILSLVRTDPQFLFERIGNLLPSQLSALVPSVHTLEVSDSVFPLASRGRTTQPLFSKRTTAHATAFKEHVLGFERTDPLSALIFNVFASSGSTDSREAQLRLDVWSSTCAKLVSYGGSSHYSLVGHLLSAWSTSTEWKAKPKFEIYLMDVLQKGAFLLQHPETPRRLGHDGELPDPLRTSVAEEFFQSAVRDLFEVLDDSDGGFPRGALEFGNAVLSKLGMTESRKRAVEYIIFQWFFCKFMHNALLFPESIGLLLDFHISKDARERLLGQISLRAQSQVSRELHTLPQFSYFDAKIRIHIDNMLSHLCNPISSSQVTINPPVAHPATKQNLPERFLLLSPTDIMTILDVLFPKAPPTFFNSSNSFNHHNHSVLSSPNNSFFPQNDAPGRCFEPNLFQGRIDTFSSRSSTAKTVFTTEMSFQDATRSYAVPGTKPVSPVSPQNSLARNADRIRYELSEINESEDRPTMGRPSSEDWALISVSNDGRTVALMPSLDQELESGGSFSNDDPDSRPASSLVDDDREMLQSAIVKLIDDFDHLEDFCHYDPITSATPGTSEPSLKQKFASAMNYCQSQADFVGAHYWWNASRLLQKVYPNFWVTGDHSKLLMPLFSSSRKSIETSTAIIEQCESRIMDLKRAMTRLRSLTVEMMTSLAKLRNKMWYMNDVKNSLRYEEARSVALALQTMAGPASISPIPEPKPRYGSRTLGASFLQKPEIQTMNAMKAPVSQGGRSKLSDEQVDMTSKWLQRSGIDNFCKGEERIHRFCLEIKAAVGKLVGETMYETPVLWSSELYQKERTIYDASGGRPVTGLGASSSLRPSSIASEESLYQAPSSVGVGLRTFDHNFRSLNEAPSIVRKSSFQSLASERWRSSRDATCGDTSSIGDSPGRAISTSASDSTFWSPMHTQAQSTTSASSLHSRPPSMFSDVLTSRRPERNAQGKVAFLDELRQTLTSLLLSDLGSPVWSCGSETDAWFSIYLNQPRIQRQMERRARLERFLAECASSDDENGVPMSHKLRRSRSADAILLSVHKPAEQDLRTPTPTQSSPLQETPDSFHFAYDTAFRQLMERFSRQSNPYTKLKALQDLRSLVISSLSSRNDSQANEGLGAFAEPPFPQSDSGRFQRNSLSEGSKLPQPQSANYQSPNRNQTACSPVWGSVASYSTFPPSETEIILAMRDLIQTIQPKTLFRDLQFISAFIPSEILNKTHSGTAFLQFGLAAFALKDDVCNSMVEIADNIVSHELSKRHQRHNTLNNHSHQPTTAAAADLCRFNGLEDAKWMWIHTAREGNPVAQRELAILYLTHPEILPRVTLPLTMPRNTFKAEMMYRRDGDSKSDPQSMCLALHWMQLSAAGGDELARNRLREREEFDLIA
ncbi:conserved hypothetical protein [Histoplasma capsulatum G186AR]|uniref:Uncharacterized protein n=2 Tax=Ajellomyces capsulatus TaxID=5037 RepID=C0NTQ5_AJECG|nr:uncharacterized protein HCBG_06535 [Histoplasma capsulatum G186AR]EEH05416.1 conserved hypothetical protein [Histoplasma capsulatum G186AR]KAG5305215.1 hypothetical protein I7I52_03802 [Histoplasma capsulatum]QSS76176.1 hypothetical protein I7I50_05542 [Histoplasma capsulatum G186AR]